MSTDSSSTPPSGPVDPTAGSPKTPPLKRRYRKPEETEAPTGFEVDEAALLNVVLQSVQRRKESGEQAPAARRGITRFLARAGVSSPAPLAPDEETAPLAGDVRSLDAATAVLPKFKPAPAFADRPRFWERARWRWKRAIPYIISYLILAAVALLAYLAGRSSAPRTVVNRAPEAARTASSLPNFSGQLAKAIAADHVGDLDTAYRIADELAKDVEPGPALRAYRATLETRRGYVNDVEAELSRLSNANTPADVSVMLNTARAFNYARRRQFDDALPCFAAVAQVDPFDVANLLHWGETLRRKGGFTDAVAKFQEALDRLPDTSSPYIAAQREYIAYERRLTQVENGHAADLEPELGRRLGEPAPSSYWLLTAAAVALQKGDMPAAVEVLKKAQAIVTPGQFGTLLDDYFFRSFAYHPEMNAFQPPATPEQKRARKLSMDYFIDP